MALIANEARQPTLLLKNTNIIVLTRSVGKRTVDLTTALFSAYYRVDVVRIRGSLAA